MATYPVFLSVVFVLRNQSGAVRAWLESAEAIIAPLVSDYELIVVDNGSEDESMAAYKALTGVSGLDNVQVYALTREVDHDTAFWAGLENALGDYVAVIDPATDDIAFLPQMLEQAMHDHDIVFAANQTAPRHRLSYRVLYFFFNKLYQLFNGVHLAKEAPQYRLLSRKVVNFILQHPVPAVTYRSLASTAGFSRIRLEYRSEPAFTRPRNLRDSIDRGMRLLVSSPRGPMRMVTYLCLFGAFSNFVYSGYVIAVFLLKDNVMPGWVTLSLQQSGMFFLLSLVLLVLGEYVLSMAKLSNEGPLYHIGRELCSQRQHRRERLNLEEVSIPPETVPHV